MKYYNEIGQWPQPQSQNRRTKLKIGFVVYQKGRIRERLNKHIHFLEMLKPNLPKNRNKPKNSAKVNRLFFIWETMVGAFENILKMWVLLIFHSIHETAL